ncbi:hypothetical protein Anapl_11260 [Anas platyrhynchos]|uniref:Uncharacterized protein n=1 Tax=Anas platyrhynchos TaxID=8839 RepID=R0LG24_ANAPL|nr:hypothetical protein Anapl_11260 [Anas platyrhynchos]
MLLAAMGHEYSHIVVSIHESSENISATSGGWHRGCLPHPVLCSPNKISIHNEWNKRCASLGDTYQYGGAVTRRSLSATLESHLLKLLSNSEEANNSEANPAQDANILSLHVAVGTSTRNLWGGPVAILR